MRERLVDKFGQPYQKRMQTENGDTRAMIPESTRKLQRSRSILKCEIDRSLGVGHL
jgi:hexokinase